MNRKNQELIDTLMAISVVSKRLAKNLAKEDKHNGSDDGTGKRPECTYCCITEIHVADN